LHEKEDELIQNIIECERLINYKEQRKKFKDEENVQDKRNYITKKE